MVRGQDLDFEFECLHLTFSMLTFEVFTEEENQEVVNDLHDQKVADYNRVVGR